MPPVSQQDLWRSLEERANAPAFRQQLRDRYPHLAALVLEPASRRGFLKLLGASLAMAGLAGCRRPEERIVPHARRPEGREPGEAEHYATAMDLGGAALGLLVTSVDGRPIKVEGNPLHPASLGATSALAQAAILEMYDPERSTAVARRSGGSREERTWHDWAAFADEHFAALRASGGQGLAVLTEASSSPSLADLRQRFGAAFPQARWTEYEPVSWDNEREGTRQAFGRPLRPHLQLHRCEALVCLDAELLLHHPDAVRHAHDLARARQPDRKVMNRLYAVESSYSLTGAMADHRLPLRPADMPRFIASLVGALLHHDARGAAWEELAAVVGQKNPAPEDTQELRDRMVHDLVEHAGRSLLVAGPRQPAAVHALVAAANTLLGNDGWTVEYTEDTDPDRPQHTDAIAGLAGAIDAGEVQTLVMLGGNPAYDAPVDLAFGDRIGSVATTVRLGLYEDETSALCSWHLPRAHFLEAWGDATGPDGTVSVVQPLIAPLYEGRSSIELVAGLLGDGGPTSGRDIVRRTLEPRIGGGDERWYALLQDGRLEDSARAPVQVSLTPAAPEGEEDAEIPAVRADLATAWSGLAALAAGGTGAGLDLELVPDNRLFDGRFANNGWLQETPDPLTKVTWDNPVLIAPADADELGIQTNDRVSITAAGQTVEAVAYVMPGQARGCATLPLGYGRRAAGEVGNGVGTDGYPLRSTAAMHHIAGAGVSAAGGTHDLACTQDHYPLDPIGEQGMERRIDDLVRSADLAEYRHHPDFAAHVVHHPPLDQQWKPHEYDGHRWAMAVDLNACNGCNSCVVACQAENNIAVVGREQVEKGREMAWLRIDRYFRGDADAPAVALMPVTCHHCENAPCEQVCPVAATVHDHEGLNVMVYNRCVGTRYCSNNCPYKVRRFNFFKFMDPQTDVEKMRFNPEVTVRSRGVMEKCSFCVQRISAAKIDAGNERRDLTDGEVTSACAQACPAGAIVFGDLGDPESRIAKLHTDPRAYAMLGEMNNRPRLKYLARVTNPGGDDDGDHGTDHADGPEDDEHGGQH